MGINPNFTRALTLVKIFRAQAKHEQGVAVSRTDWCLTEWGRIAHLYAVMTLKNRKILIMGLPGAGKTTLARVVAQSLGAVWFNADEVRENINKDLGFSVDDRVEQARRMGWLCDRVVEAGGIAIADFVCPTAETREAFGEAFIVWVDRIPEGRFPDTNRLFVPPETYQIRIPEGESVEVSAKRVCTMRGEVRPSRKRGWFAGCREIVRAAVGPAWGDQVFEPRPLAYLALCLAVFALRGAVEPFPYSEANSALLFILLGSLMMARGMVSVVISLATCTVIEFFFIQPALTLGVHNWWASVQFAIAAIASSCIAVLIDLMLPKRDLGTR